MKKVKNRLFQIDPDHNRQHLGQLSNAKQVQYPSVCVIMVLVIFYWCFSY